ncbi:MAG: hypothetical protein ABJK39_14595 [Hyphomicrobiales bacterium]
MLKSTKFCRTGLTLSLVAFLASGCGISTATYGTGQTVEAGLARDIASLATFGVVGKKKAPRISYRERAPLVVPNDQQFASIPAPIDAVEGVAENFPGRAAELALEKEKKSKKEALAIVNPRVGVARALPQGTALLKDKKGKPSPDFVPRGNAIFGDNVPLDTRELTKTPEDHARERGVTVDELPESLRGDVVRGDSLLARAGLVKPKISRRSQSLTDVPIEYRTVQKVPISTEVNQVSQVSQVGQISPGAVLPSGQIPTPQDHIAASTQANQASSPSGTYSVEPIEEIAPKKKKKKFIFF